MNEYLLIEDEDLRKFLKRVNSEIDDGARCEGGVSIAKHVRSDGEVVTTSLTSTVRVSVT